MTWQVGQVLHVKGTDQDRTVANFSPKDLYWNRGTGFERLLVNLEAKGTESPGQSDIWRENTEVDHAVVPPKSGTSANRRHGFYQGRIDDFVDGGQEH